MSANVSVENPSARLADAAALTSRGLLILLGIVGIASATYFSFFASPQEGGVSTTVDWLVAGWKVVVSAGFVTAALMPGLTRRRRVSFGTALVLADILFGFVKLFGYGESEAVWFFLPNAVLLALLWLAGRPPR